MKDVKCVGVVCQGRNFSKGEWRGKKEKKDRGENEN